MPRPATITYEVVSAAADAFLARESRDPTLIELRVELGNTGSMTTISEHLRTWKARRQERPAPLPVALPADLKAQVDDLGRVLWVAATAAADERIKAAEIRIGAERTEIANEREQTGAAMQVLEAERDQALARVAEVEAAREADQIAAAAELQKVRDLLTQIDDQVQAARTAEREADRRAELAEERARGMEARLADMERTVSDARIERDQIRGERDQARTETAKLRTDLDAAMNLASETQAENASLLTARDGLRERLEAAERQAQMEADRRATIEEREQKTQAELTQAKAEVARLNERLRPRELSLPKPTA